jgi:hypothetical protein
MYLKAVANFGDLIRGIHMAKKRARAEPRNLEVRVPVPQNTSIRVTDLKSLSDRQIDDILKKAKTAKVGFVILNAPFKVRPVEPVS